MFNLIIYLYSCANETFAHYNTTPKKDIPAGSYLNKMYNQNTQLLENLARSKRRKKKK